MRRAARFRFLFGWVVEQLASPERNLAGFAASFEAADVALPG
jgi:hypothetical protein